MAKSGKKGNFTFEEALKRLEVIVEQLESEEVLLEESLGLYTEGQQLLKICAGHLDSAELKIKQLLENDEGELREEPLALDEDEDNGSDDNA